MPHSQMVINYVPGDECRVAIVEDGKLEELSSERFAAASRVGNIYVGKVTNVEPSIQAAFVDFGVEENGFLHYSDLHPRYFPGEDVDEATERVGHKTPRRERPPIQQCLRRGQEVTVQVLKEGVGTKGPTLTSYLSIPGRYLVMMPQMDKVGVSRKVEDEELRRKMREILDQLELPDGFGFILRTAGMERTKLELKRDLAYLQRLWKDMEKRLQTGAGKPRLLYSESDLLVRSLRDQLTADINEVVIDHELALQRASRFMKIVAPRSHTKLLHYTSKTPIFHAFGVEQQIAMIHAREVPLPSGGRLVIDQTEALVAIDVNSGKARDSRDAETNAYKTNLEAVDEICRQLRLRDLGGIVINDLIDMRSLQHRKDVEARFKERLKRDKARSTCAQISQFGILEMTRQRMRGSHESVHFVDCPTCHGRGLVQRPDSVASDALRDLAALLDAERVGKVEMVVAPRVAGELLSTKRQLLGRIERASGKRVDVRVSEATPVDRVTFYAYDPSGADLDIANLPRPKKVKDVVEWEPAPAAESAEPWPDAELPSEPEPDGEELPTLSAETHPIEVDEGELVGEDDTRAAGEQAGHARRKRRRRRGRGRGGQRPDLEAPAPLPSGALPPRQLGPRLGDHGDGAPIADESTEDALGADDQPSDGLTPDQGQHPGQPQPGQDIGPDGMPRRKRRRRGRRGRRGGGGGAGGPPGTPTDQAGATASADSEPFEPAPKPHAPPGTGYRNTARERPAANAAPAPHPADVPAPSDGDVDAQPSSDGFDDGSREGGGGGRGGRRRRRRRGRRGGGGGGGDSPGLGRAGAGHAESAQPSRSPSVNGAPRRDPAPPPAPVPPAPKPKLLYSSRRRLLPSELNKRPKAE